MSSVVNPFTGRWIMEPKTQNVWGNQHATWFTCMGIGGGLFINRMLLGVEMGRLWGMTWADIDAVVIGKAPDMFEGVAMPELYLADALGAAGKPMIRVHTAGSVGGSTATKSTPSARNVYDSSRLKKLDVCGNAYVSRAAGIE